MLQILADGLVIGSVIALGAIGLSLTFSILRFANFAHGELLAWGAYLALTALAMCTAVLSAMGAAAPIAPFSFGWPLLAAMAVSALLTGLLALVLDGLLFRRLRRSAPSRWSSPASAPRWRCATCCCSSTAAFRSTTRRSCRSPLRCCRAACGAACASRPISCSCSG